MMSPYVPNHGYVPDAWRTTALRYREALEEIVDWCGGDPEYSTIEYLAREALDAKRKLKEA